MEKNSIMKMSVKVFIVGMFVLFITGTVFSNTTQPERFKLDFDNNYLIFMPNALSMQIITENNVLSYGEDWEIKQLKPYLFHLRLRSWQGFYWMLNTSRKEVYRVRNNQFGTIGGDQTKLPITVTNSQNNFKLYFSNSYLICVPNTRTLQIVAEGNVLSYGTNWTVKQMKPYLYDLKKNSWQGFFWRVNTSRKELYMVRGTFGTYGGTSETKNADVIVTY
jgi:predicted secreted protein